MKDNWTPINKLKLPLLVKSGKKVSKKELKEAQEKNSYLKLIIA